VDVIRTSSPTSTKETDTSESFSDNGDERSHAPGGSST
jgi:hypothetical protein